MRVGHKFKIRRYYGFTVVTVPEADLPAHLEELKAVGTFDGLVIVPDLEPRVQAPGNFPRISAMWAPDGNGFVIQCFESAQTPPCFLATSGRLSEPEVPVELGGSFGELWPRELFVPQELALEVLRGFLQTGAKSPRRTWIAQGDFQRRTDLHRTQRELASAS